MSIVRKAIASSTCRGGNMILHMVVATGTTPLKLPEGER